MMGGVFTMLTSQKIIFCSYWEETKMAKIKIFPKRKSFLSKTHVKKKSTNREIGVNDNVIIQKNANLKEYDPVKNLLDINKMGAAIMQCFIENDTEGVLEIIETYLYALNKTQFLKEAKVPRSTVYNFFKRRNPTIKTLAKILHNASIQDKDTH